MRIAAHPRRREQESEGTGVAVALRTGQGIAKAETGELQGRRSGAGQRRPKDEGVSSGFEKSGHRFWTNADTAWIITRYGRHSSRGFRP